MGKILPERIEHLSPRERAALAERFAEQTEWSADWQQFKLDVQKLEGRPITNLELVRRFFHLIYDEHNLFDDDSAELDS